MPRKKKEKSAVQAPELDFNAREGQAIAKLDTVISGIEAGAETLSDALAEDYEVFSDDEAVEAESVLTSEVKEPLSYEAFLESKRLDAKPAGLDLREDDLPGWLFPFQRRITAWALRRGKAAVFADTGLGKTRMQLCFADHIAKATEKPVLILAPLGVTYQTADEAGRLGLEIKHCMFASSVQPGVNITNYEKLDRFDPSIFAGIVLDESSILKAVDGKTRAKIIEMFCRTPYRLACTATPAPNDHMELGNHSEFLGIMTRAEMLAMFFTHDGGETSKWRLKGHAEKRFWEWVASWAVMVRKPSDLGFADDGYILPEIRFHECLVEGEFKQEGYLFPVGGQTIQERRAARRASMDDRVAACAERIKASSEQWLCWVDLNDEQEALAKALGANCVSIRGSTPDDQRLEYEQRWRAGRVQTLITKGQIFGFGMNWQHCYKVAYVGLSDSWERFYQETRRVWRFGQTHNVDCYMYLSEAEYIVLDNLRRKEKDADTMQEGMLEHMKQVGELVEATERERSEYVTAKSKGDGWTLYLGDCVEAAAKIADGSIDYSVFSPPFASLYTYSNSERDMGNSKNDATFGQHFGFLVKELYRVLRPGRLLSFHCMNLPTSKQNHGRIGLRDFRGELIRAFEQVGFIYHSEVVIWKDPVTSMQRTKAIGLLHKQLCKDSAMSRQSIPDYLVTMRKPGENVKPVRRESDYRFDEYVGDEGPEGKMPARRYSIEVWQRYASPVWFDINPSDTLQYTTARDDKDERHICPLQLQVIERAIELWTNPDDLILSPFAGIGSEGYVAVRKGRQFVGIELKESYWKVAVRNLQEAERQNKQRQIPLFADEAVNQ